eukprot:1382676-Prymnesium_polylepis.2
MALCPHIVMPHESQPPPTGSAFHRFSPRGRHLARHRDGGGGGDWSGVSRRDTALAGGEHRG